MKLPIDARKLPFKDKYLYEETEVFAQWFIFGVDSTDKTQCLAWKDGEVIVGLTLEQANNIITLRDKFCKDLKIILDGEIRCTLY